MKKKLLTVSVGIPAYNEEANIERLLISLLEQKKESFTFEKILVVSDGSTDETVNKVRKIQKKFKIRKKPRIYLTVRKKRIGLNNVQNNILLRSSSDVLVIINADVLPKNKFLLMHIVDEFYKDSSLGLVAAKIKSMVPDTLVGKILANSHDLKQTIFQRLNQTNNIYLCHGSARGFSKAFYKSFRWPYNCPEDSYSYFVCLKKGFKFLYAKKAIIMFSPSKNIKDHQKQSERYFDGKEVLNKFASADTSLYYKIPLTLFISTFIIFLIKRPILTSGYLAIFLFIRFITTSTKIDHSKYEISTSSKDLPR